MTVPEATIISRSPYNLTRSQLCVDDVVLFQGRKYQLIKNLGEGSNNIIFKVKDLSTSKSVAFKVSKGGVLSDKDTVFIFNARIYDRKDDPRQQYILHIDAHFSLHLRDKERSIFVLKKYKCDLGKVLQEKKHLKLDEIRKIFFDVLQGLSYFHERNVYHGDLKPANILLDKTGRCVLADFDCSAALPFRLFPIQTELYRAPEASTTNYNTLIDMWSVGCIAIELYKGFLTSGLTTSLSTSLTAEDDIKKLLCTPSETVLESRYEKRLFTEFVTSCLKVDPVQRMTASGALACEFMKFSDSLDASAA